MNGYIKMNENENEISNNVDNINENINDINIDDDGQENDEFTDFLTEEDNSSKKIDEEDVVDFLADEEANAQAQEINREEESDEIVKEPQPETDKVIEEVQSEKDILTTEEIMRRDREMLKQSEDENNVFPDYLNYLWAVYANFEIMIVSPFIETKKTPTIIKPDYDKEKQTYESVYLIADHGYAFRTARGSESSEGTTAMGKMYRTIQKIIRLVIKRLEEHAVEDGGTFDPQTEVKLALFGYELSRRKSFALIMDLDVNINIVNFDPRVWGERFIANLKYMITSGHGCPVDLKNVSERVVPGGLTK